jgi:hypothetical protein
MSGVRSGLEIISKEEKKCISLEQDRKNQKMMDSGRDWDQEKEADF